MNSNPQGTIVVVIAGLLFTAALVILCWRQADETNGTDGRDTQ